MENVTFSQIDYSIFSKSRMEAAAEYVPQNRQIINNRNERYDAVVEELGALHRGCNSYNYMERYYYLFAMKIFKFVNNPDEYYTPSNSHPYIRKYHIHKLPFKLKYLHYSKPRLKIILEAFGFYIFKYAKLNSASAKKIAEYGLIQEADDTRSYVEFFNDRFKHDLNRQDWVYIPHFYGSDTYNEPLKFRIKYWRG